MNREHRLIVDVPGLSVTWWGPYRFGTGGLATPPEVSLRAYRHDGGIDIGMSVALTPNLARTIGTALIDAAGAAEAAPELRDTDPALPVLDGGK